MSIKTTDDERRAIESLKSLASRWPKSLWLFSASGTLWVMKKKDGERVMLKGKGAGFDQACAIETIDIPNDGGDW